MDRIKTLSSQNPKNTYCAISMNIVCIAVHQALFQAFSKMLDLLITSNLGVSSLFIVYFRMLCFNKSLADVSPV